MIKRTIPWAFVLTLFTCIPLISQNPGSMPINNDPYTDSWKIIDSLEEQGLPRSALEQASILLERAKQDKRPAQQVKAAMRIGSYESELSEAGLVANITFLEKELTQASFPAAAVYQSILGELYMDYLRNNIWRIRGRETVQGDPGADIQTWSVEQLLSRSTQYYLASVEQVDALRKVPVDAFDAITRDGERSDHLRPTLFDFLAHRAIDHFANELTYITQPAYQFSIDDEAAFAPVSAFTRHRFRTEDDRAFPFLTLRLFQQLLEEHLEDTTPAALIDADLKRLRLMHEKAVLTDKDSLYLAALEGLADRHRQDTVYTEIVAQLAEFRQGLSGRYSPDGDEAYRWEAKKAYELCTMAIEKFPDSYGAKRCKEIQQSISSKDLNLKIEQVNLPVQPSLLHISYRNIQDVFVQVFRMEEGQSLSDRKYEEQLRFIDGKRPVQTWSQKLPDEGDFQNHSAELAIPVLNIGRYLVVVSDSKKIERTKTQAAAVETTVSQLAYLQRRRPDNRMEFVVVNRSSGAPMGGVKAEFFTRMFNRQKQTYELNKVGESISDPDGFINPEIAGNIYFRVKLSLEQDVLFLDEGYSHYNTSELGRAQQLVHFFLDRAIYRPGQTVYFKGIVMQKDAETGIPRILANEPVTVSLYDVNGQEVKNLELTSNEYGTVSGQLITPSSGLLGQMFLRAGTGQVHYFRVEEYKRPRFEVTFEPPADQPQLDAEVTITGRAAGFAGDQVQGADVSYRVVREIRYPWMPWWRRNTIRFPGGQSASMEITNGNTRTSDDGTFEVSFTAKADPGVDEKNQPMFVFTVYADVTDITGETHTGEKSLQLAKIGLQATVEVPEAADRRQSLDIDIRTTNLDGEPQAVAGELVVERLLAPDHPYLQRYWPKPDYHLMDQTTFSQLFPLLPYQDEDQIQNWAPIRVLHRQELTTGNTETLALDAADWPVGHYRLTFRTEDQRGNEVETQAFFQLYDRAAKQIPTNEWLWTQLDQKQYEPKDLANLAIASAVEGWQLLYEVERRDKKEGAHWIRLPKWLDMNELVTEEDRGNFHLKVAGIRYNRVFSSTLTVRVPWSNKDLNISYQTFRDKVRPGAEEEWQLKISGAAGEAVAAEMVAAMYDASLDQFAANNWRFSAFPVYTSEYSNWDGSGFHARDGRWISSPEQQWDRVPERSYRQLDWRERYMVPRPYMATARSAPPSGEPVEMMDMAVAASAMKMNAADTSEAMAAEAAAGTSGGEQTAAPPITPRRNLNETVFFLPELRTDEAGNIIISFTMNEALTRWKFLAFAHTRELATAVSEREVVTQKELMVLPSAPRFFREGDQITFTAKVSNLTESPLSGTARLELLDARSGQSIDLAFGNDQANVAFQTDAKGSAAVEWALKIPKERSSAVIYRVTARAGSFSDGEEAALPVLTNRMLVTESLPLALRGGERKTFELNRLGQVLQSPSAKAHQFTLEFTSNPAWYAVQALPYLMEYPYECTEQIFNRYYANALAASAANRYPKIRKVFTEWRDQAQDAMLSNLRKNEELKSLLLEETPWVLAAQSEDEQKQHIGLLFDLDRMSREEEVALAKLEDRQDPDGGFSWFPGGSGNWHMTQYVVQGIGRLRKLNAADPAYTGITDRIALQGIAFMDRQLMREYNRLKEAVDQQKTTWEQDHLHSLIVHYLYTRTLFDVPATAELQTIIDYYLGQAEKYWLDKGLYEQGLIALALAQRDQMDVPGRILASMRERALQHEELGMYWKHPPSWFWHQLPIETHALLIEVFEQLQAPPNEIESLKIWLLKNKQTNHWPTTTATAAAVYALLSSGDNWLAETQALKIRFPGWNKQAYEEQLDRAQQSAESGTGYFKAQWQGSEIDTELDKIRVVNPNNNPAWGAAYWQYFEDLEKIDRYEDTPLQLNKQLLLEKPGERGPVLEPLPESAVLHPGDKLVVRLELRVDRAMEYVHMKDTRAAGLEPINALSQYHWQDGLGYYESPGDAATNFFFDQLPTGTYVFEYPLRVTYKGEFSNGITSIQCMYAPEFSSHSEGARVSVK